MEPVRGRPGRGLPVPLLLLPALAIPLVVMVRLVARGPRALLFLGALFPLLFLAVGAFMLGQRHARLRRTRPDPPGGPVPPPAQGLDPPAPGGP